MRLAKQLLVVLPLIWVGVGCAAMNQVANVQRPTASLTGMNLGEVTAEGFRMNFLVNVNNPNAVALPIKGADYELGVAGVKVLSDEAKLDAGLAANASTAVTVPVMVRFEDLLKAKEGIVKGGGDVPFALSGNMKFNGPGWLGGQGVEVPLQYSGTLPVKQIVNNPQAVLQSPAARELAQQLVGSWLGR